jgi:hypothetical protein
MIVNDGMDGLKKLAENGGDPAGAMPPPLFQVGFKANEIAKDNGSRPKFAGNLPPPGIGDNVINQFAGKIWGQGLDLAGGDFHLSGNGMGAGVPGDAAPGPAGLGLDLEIAYLFLVCGLNNKKFRTMWIVG